MPLFVILKTECKEFLTFANHISKNPPKAPFCGCVRKNQPFLIILNYIIEKFPIIVCVNYGTSFQIIPKTIQIWRYLELNSTNVCIFWTLGKFGQRDARISVNMFITMNKIREIWLL